MPVFSLRAALRPAVLVVLTTGLTACISAQERTSVSVGYYDVAGESFEELDRQISLHGPKVPGVGEAIAATQVRMVPDIRYGETRGRCQVTRAVVRVKADVTLPRLANKARVEQGLGKAFNNLETYARMHEAVHVAIADKHAEMAEKAILSIGPKDDCTSLREEVVRRYDAVIAEHQREQIRFDEEERKRFEKAAQARAETGSQVLSKTL